VTFRIPLALCASAVLLAACSFENRYERQAGAITQAVANNDLGPVARDVAPGVKITRVQVAEWSDELSQQGKLLSVKQVEDGCPAGTYCFNVKFEKRAYQETMRLDDRGLVTFWHFQAAGAGAAPSPG
jgi:hypothetical protein